VPLENVGAAIAAFDAAGYAVRREVRDCPRYPEMPKMTRDYPRLPEIARDCQR